MRPTHPLQRLVCVAALILSLMLACSAVVAAPAQAAARHSATGDTVSLSITNGTTFTYGAVTGPTFQVIVVMPTKPTLNRFWQVTIYLSDGETFGGGATSVSADQLTYTFNVETADISIPVGNLSAYATFDNPPSNSPESSGSVTFTVTKATPTLDCKVAITTSIFPVGTTFTFDMQYEGDTSYAPVDWQDGTYTIAFVGPGMVTHSDLRADSNDSVTVAGPTQIGRYDYTCAFSGTSNFVSAQSKSSGQPLLISAMHPLSDAQIYTNPTTLDANKSTQIYVVVRGGAGLPTPSGYFSFQIGQQYTGELPLGSDGTALVTLNPLWNLYGANGIELWYHGDPYYNIQSFAFPLTNPAIPSGSSGGSGGGGAPAQPKATATTTASATVIDGATPAATGSSSGGRAILAANSAPFGGGMGWLLAALVGLLVVAGGIGGIVFWRSRRRAASLAMASASPTRSPLDEDTLPDSAPDR